MKIQFRMKSADGLYDETLDNDRPFHFKGVDPNNVDGEVVLESLIKAMRKCGTVYPGDTISVVAVDEETDRLD